MSEVISLPKLELLPFVLLDDFESLPTESGVYFVAWQGIPIYIGKAKNLKKRWADHHRKGEVRNLSGVCVHWLSCPINRLDFTENALINFFAPPMNATGFRTANPLDQFLSWVALFLLFPRQS